MAEPTQATPLPQLDDDQLVATVHVTARRHRDDLVVVTVDGEIDLSNIALLENVLGRLEGEPWLVIDLSAVRFCAVVGVRLLHTMAVRSSVDGRRFEVVVSPAIARLLKGTGLADGITRRTALRRSPAGPQSITDDERQP